MHRLLLIFGLGIGMLTEGWAQEPSVWQLPDGFTHETVLEAPAGLNGLTFGPRGRTYLWLKRGQVMVYEGDSLINASWIDLREEVADWRDHGLLGFTLDPEFDQNGYLYLFYTVDRHHLMHYGTSSYSPNTNEYFQATIARITRYQADPSTDFTTVLPDSRKVLVGETPQSGIPLVHESHGVGTLEFGQDGSLLVSIGDGGSFYGRDVGGDQNGAYAPQALADGILRPKEDVGTYRAQLIDCFNGKLLRVNPETGEGLPDNPFYDAANPAAPRSCVWALGLRNPFRFTVVPNGKPGPGTLLVGDVGLWGFEEINVIEEPGLNFGWPIYEGLDTCHDNFHLLEVLNLDAPVAGTRNCGLDYFPFAYLLKQRRGEGKPRFSHPCNSLATIPSSVPQFVHTPPALAWPHELNSWEHPQIAFYPDSGNIQVQKITAANSPVLGDAFWGPSVTGGAYYQADNFPPEYQNVYFFADYVSGWVKGLRFDSLWRPTEVLEFIGSPHNPSDIKVNPLDGCLYYIHYPQQLRRICFGGNVAPDARLDANPIYGPSPLEVQFSAESTTDFNGDPLTVAWDFGDGTTSDAWTATHTFTNDSDDPKSQLVTLTVEDTAGGRTVRQQWISLDNTPPQVQIEGIPDGFTYPAERTLIFPLTAQAFDQEHNVEDLSFQWQAILHHNTHEHPEEVQYTRDFELRLSATGCDPEETHWYRVILTATDPAGLSTTVERIIDPDCIPAVAWGEVSAALVEADVEVQWATEFEQDIDHFVVERAIGDSGEFVPIGVVDPQGTPQEGTTYTWMDEEQISGTLRYQIRLVEDGPKQEVSPTVRVDDARPKLLLVYPNPTIEQVTVDPGFVESEAVLVLFDAIGRELKRWRWEAPDFGPRPVDLPDLPFGVYRLQLTNGSETQSFSLQISD